MAYESVHATTADGVLHAGVFPQNPSQMWLESLRTHVDDDGDEVLIRSEVIEISVAEFRALYQTVMLMSGRYADAQAQLQERQASGDPRPEQGGAKVLELVRTDPGESSDE